MKKLIFFAAFFTFTFYGCLIGHKIVYEVKPAKDKPGTATVYYTDIRSDAANDQEFEEDKTNLLNYMLKSDKFLNDMKAEGKDIVSRELLLEKGKLNGKAVYNYNKLNDVEGLAYEDGFYFLTLALDDSVLSTNGEIIRSATYKRILWDESVLPLKFEILIEPPANTKLRSLNQFYKPEKK